MRTSTLIIFILTISLFATSQTSLDVKKEVPISIDISCGYAGQTSNSVYFVRDILLTKNDTALVKLISSDNKTLKLLAIIAIDNISSDRLIFLTQEQKKIFSDFKKNKDVVKVCEACEGHYTTTVQKLFKQQKSAPRRAIDSGLKLKN